jgi:hypothetical protein
MATAKGIKLPVIITADGTQAQAGFTKLRNSMQGLERGFGKYLSRQAGAITGMIGGFFTLDALFSGIQRLIAHGEEVNKRISQYSPEAIAAGSRLEAARIKQDVATATQMGPQIAEVTKRQEAAVPSEAVAGVAASTVALQAIDVWTYLKEQLDRNLTGNAFTGEGLKTLGKLTGLGGEEDPLEAMQRKLQQEQAIAPVPVPNVPFEQQSPEVQQSIETVNLLREAVQELRGMNRQLKAN